MSRAFWKIYRVQSQVLDAADVQIKTREEFSSATGIGLPEVIKMLPEVPNGLYKTRTKKKVENAIGALVATRVCFRAVF